MTTDGMEPTRLREQGPDDEEPNALGAQALRSRRRILTMVLGGAGTLALAASGTLALRQAAAKDDDDEGGNSGSGGDDGHDDDDHGSSGGDGDDDRRDDDDDDSGRGRGRGRGGDDDDEGDDDRGGDDRDDAGAPAGTPMAGVTEIRITDDDADAFLPQSVTVEPGTSVTFVNNDDKDHTATGAGFDTGILAPGESGTVTLDEPGTWRYACLIHPEMTGTIVVSGVSGATPMATPRVVEGSAGPSGAATVTISNFAFAPDELTISVGATVTWENTDSAPHTATAEDGGFDTDSIDTGGSAQVTFDTPGTFTYVCLFHPNMRATITVV